MGLLNWLRNAVGISDAGRESANLNENKLLEWLGIDRSHPEAINETTYYICLKVLSETMGKLPLKLYAEDKAGGRIRAPVDDESDVVLNRPNPAMTPATFWSTMEANCNHFGNAYAWIQRISIPDGRFGGHIKITGLWPMRSDYVTVYMDDAGIFGNRGQLYYHYRTDAGNELIFRQDNILHLKTWMTWDGVMGKSVQDILYSTVAGSGYAQRYLEKLYESGLTASSVLQYTGDLDENLRKQLQKKYNALLSGAQNAGKVVALPVGMTLSPLSYKLADAQFMELKKYSSLQIAAAFGVKPDQINDYEKSSYSSSEAQQLAFLTDTMLYRLAQYEQEIQYKLLTAEQRAVGMVYKFNEKVLLRATAQVQMQTIASGINNGIYTPNEARNLLDLPSREGGDVLIVNGNYVPLTSVGAAYGLSQKGGEENNDSENEW